MKYAITAVIVIAILGIGGFYFYNESQSNPDVMMQKDDAMMESGDTMEKSDVMMDKNDEAMEGSEEAMMEGDGAMVAKGQYLLFTPEALEHAKGKKRVLFFYANWCPTCKPADADFSANVGKFPEDLALIRVNYNDTDTDADEKALAEKYGVTYQHTFIQIDDNGEVITKWNGGGTDKLLSSIK